MHTVFASIHRADRENRLAEAADKAEMNAVHPAAGKNPRALRRAEIRLERTVHDQSQRFQIDLRLQKLAIGQSCHVPRPLLSALVLRLLSPLYTIFPKIQPSAAARGG